MANRVITLSEEEFCEISTDVAAEVCSRLDKVIDPFTLAMVSALLLSKTAHRLFDTEVEIESEDK